LAGLDHYLADLRLALERMHRYGLKMNPRKCAFGVSAGKFFGFIIHEKGIDIDPKRIEAMKKVEAPACNKDLQKFLGKVNYLRRFISNLSGKIDAFTPILRLKDEAELTWGQNIKRLLRRSRNICLHPRFSRRLREVLLLGFKWLQKTRLLMPFCLKKPKDGSISSHMLAVGLLMQKRGIHLLRNCAYHYIMLALS
jgi:hypothetical protein